MDKILTEQNIDIKGDHLNWLRWNLLIINSELDAYQQSMLIGENIHKSISILKDGIEVIVEKYFRLSEAEKSISNGYEQAYKFASRRNDARLFQQAGRLFKNYINLLKIKYYIDKLDKEGVTLAQLYSEADFLVSKLSNIDKQLAEAIKNITELYDEFIKSDSDSQTNRTGLYYCGRVKARSRTY